MNTRLGLMSWAAGALVLAAASACGNTDTNPSPPPASSTSPSSSSTSASPTSPSDAAASQASKTMRQYFAVVDDLSKDPDSGLNKLNTVATSTQLNAARTLLRNQHDRGQRQVGDTRVAELTVQSVDLDNSDPSAGKVPTVVIDVCWDVSKVDVLDKDGTSIVSPSRPDTGWTRYTVANYDYVSDPNDGWRVANGQDLKQAPCAAS